MTKQKRILLVEDEDKIRKVVEINLKLEGYEVVSIAEGDLALRTAETQRFDLLLLDIMLPKMSGLKICEHVRLKNKEIPIIFISAKDSSEDRIRGLKVGADDYLIKPFSLEELLLRVDKLLQRTAPNKSAQVKEFQFGENSLDFKSYTAYNGTQNFKLTQKEALLLQLFIDKSNQAISRQQILEYVWGYDVFPSTRTIDNFILSFRKKFEADPKHPRYFHSIRGVGYKFTP